ncbi:secretory phospholipase A2 receptor-like [Cololabis saira]|uniref:secretory phospholipase A2 receptor-like n=1 Tax=Cololabis saira TaxID=129043 RepID=UPI002AD2A1ED|nr:secretory phospholipase A2 receptor-like [Cololabis saira]
MTWLEAQSYCRENHTDLASGPHQLKDTQLQQLPELQKLNGTEENNHAFIGLYRDTWRWSDGSSFSFRHWRPGSGISTKHIRYVMVEKNGRWTTDESSISRKPFFCYDDKVILIQQNLTWEDALYYCREKHRDLVSITDLNDQRWVQERVKNATTEYVWMGLRYTCTLDFWFWVGGEVVTYQNVDPGQKGDHCDMSGAMQRAGKHKWFKKNDMNEFNFLCSEW